MDEPLKVEPLGRGTYLIASDPERRIAYAVSQGSQTWVFIEGRTCVIEARERDVLVRSQQADDQLALSAPMPATVLSILVAPGQDVREGDLLIVLEAMKMEVPIRAPRAARVQSIACRQGELVQPGVPLLELDDVAQ
jgi:3-methylcrotonyl-CoA carboxylase alpha subunit